MKLTKFTRFLVLFMAGVGTTQPGWTQTYKVLYSFTGGDDGLLPEGTLIRDSAGNLYGTTVGGGGGSGFQEGSVFKLSPNGKLKVLHNFTNDPQDASWPVAGLLRDAAGDLFGVSAGLYYASGIAFKITKSGEYTVLHTFGHEDDGAGPDGPLVSDSSGNLYGTSHYGGNSGCPVGIGCGVAFKLDPAGNETPLRIFKNGKRGAQPNGGVIRDSAGNLYGTADAGGHNGHGTVYKLDTAGNQTSLYTFQAQADGEFPGPGLLQDAAGNLYGTAGGGILDNGKKGAGVIFKLDTTGAYSVLYTFTGRADGQSPNGFLIMDGAGSLYGTTFSGGLGSGVVFKLDRTGKQTVLYTFEEGPGGNYPVGGLTIDSAGNLYGTAAHGGNGSCNDAGCGVVFKITP